MVTRNHKKRLKPVVKDGFASSHEPVNEIVESRWESKMEVVELVVHQFLCN